jgi:hypothetical protein
MEVCECCESKTFGAGTVHCEISIVLKQKLSKCFDNLKTKKRTIWISNSLCDTHSHVACVHPLNKNFYGSWKINSHVMSERTNGRIIIAQCSIHSAAYHLYKMTVPLRLSKLLYTYTFLYLNNSFIQESIIYAFHNHDTVLSYLIYLMTV